MPTAISGAWSHFKRGNVATRVAMLLAPGAAVGGLIGASVAQGLDRDTLRIVFGVLLFYFALRYLGVEAWVLSRLSASPDAKRAAQAVPGPETAPKR